MAKTSNQKLKLLYILKMLKEKTDDEHGLTANAIVEELEKNGISAERKSIYNDINELIAFGYDIVNNKARENGGYHLVSREFELPELKLLVDAVQASKFITRKKSGELIKKLESLTSSHEAKQLQRQVIVSDRIKTENESVFYNVDYIHRAIQTNRQIKFRYFEWNMDKQMHFRKAGASYTVSPFFLIWKEEFYYMIAYDSDSEIMKYYRVDKMAEISISENKRLGHEAAEGFHPARQATRTFHMYSGEEQMVTMTFSNKLIGVVIDRFGREIDIRKREEDRFSVRVPVAVSSQFYGWITGLGNEAEITSPEEVRSGYRQYLEDIMDNYRNSDSKNPRRKR